MNSLSEEQKNKILRELNSNKFTITLFSPLVILYSIFFLFSSDTFGEYLMGALLCILSVLMIYSIHYYSNAKKLLKAGRYEIKSDIVVGKRSRKNSHTVLLLELNKRVDCERFLWFQLQSGDTITYVVLGKYNFIINKG